MVVIDEDPMNEFQEQPAAADEGGKGFDDMPRLELCEDRR